MNRSDALIICKSFREDWKTDEDAKKRAVQEMCSSALESENLRRLTSCVHTLCAGADADLRRLTQERDAGENPATKG